MTRCDLLGAAAERRIPCRWFVHAAILVAVGGSACKSSATTGTTLPTDGVVYGTVRDGTGALLQGAEVAARFFRAPCATPPPSPSVVRGTTLADGTYRLSLRGPNFGVFAACVIVQAESAGGQTGTAPGVTLVMRDELNGRPDSVRVDVSVP